MLSIPTHFPEAAKCSQLFEASANEIRESALVLSDLLTSSPREFDRETISRIEEQSEQINEQIATLLCQSFITPFEWQDLDELSCTLCRIARSIRKLSIRMLLSQSYLPIGSLDVLTKILTEATSVAHEMVRQLWHQPDFSRIKEENDRLYSLEDEADKLVFEMLCNLYRGKYEVLQAIILCDLLQIWEKLIDHCRDAGNVIYRIVLEYS
jgi:uncharacterized protein